MPLSEYTLPFLKGFLLMASVIFAVGPQNALLIRQGLRREQPFSVAFVFTLCDALLITLGVMGVGQYIAKLAWLRVLVVYGGAAFLLMFAAKSFYAAWRGGKAMTEDVSPRDGLVATAIAVSILNPGAIIDTVVIIGAVSSKYDQGKAIAFGLGAQTFSTAFFFLIAAFTSSLAPFLKNSTVWRWLDMIMGLITAWIAVHLLFFEF